jgi:hypothetical protein
MPTATPIRISQETPDRPALCLAFALGATQWQRGFTTGAAPRPRERHVPVRHVEAVREESRSDRATGSAARHQPPQVAPRIARLGEAPRQGLPPAAGAPPPVGRYPAPGGAAPPSRPSVGTRVGMDAAQGSGRSQRSRPKFPVKLLGGRSASPGTPLLRHVLQRDQGMLQMSDLLQIPYLVLLELDKLLLPPAFTHSDEHGEDHLPSARFIPQMGQDFRPPPLLFNGPFGQSGRPHLLAMPCGHLPMIEAGLSLIFQTPTCCRADGLVLEEYGLVSPLPCLKGRGLPHVGHQGCAGWPGLRGHFWVEMRHLLPPAAHPPRA